MVKFFSQFYPLGTNIVIQRNPACLAAVKGKLVPYIKQNRNYADKGKYLFT
jgi:hypothetical protein